MSAPEEQMKLNVVDESDDVFTYEQAMNEASVLIPDDVKSTKELLLKCLAMDAFELEGIQKEVSKRTGRSLKTVRSTFEALRRKAAPDSDTSNNTHGGYAQLLIKDFTFNIDIASYPPVGCRGEVYHYNPNKQIWKGCEHLTREITGRFDGMEKCKSSTDYKGIFRTAYLLQEDKELALRYFKWVSQSLIWPRADRLL